MDPGYILAHSQTNDKLSEDDKTHGTVVTKLSLELAYHVCVDPQRVVVDCQMFITDRTEDLSKPKLQYLMVRGPWVYLGNQYLPLSPEM